jgi:hypothetical protein
VVTRAKRPPLGLRSDVHLTAAQARTLQVLQDYDLSFVRARLLREGAMPMTWLDEALLEFRRYLGLRVLCGRMPMMFSKHVDAVWHSCLLFTRLYADLCQRAFGEFVHHDPVAVMGPVGDPAARWEEFVAAYERYYGPLGRLWRLGRTHES